MESNAEEVRLIAPSASPAQIEAHLAAFDAESEILSEQTEDTDDALTFELEHQLRDFIIANLGSLDVNGRKLMLFQGEDGRSGREYSTGVGFIDILAKDAAGNLFVFELKRARTSDHTVGQVLRYMGWLRHHLANGREVHGIIVAKSLGQSLRYAVSETQNVTAFEYSVHFTLHHATLSPTIPAG